MDIAERSDTIEIGLSFNIANNLVSALNESSEYIPSCPPFLLPPEADLSVIRWSQTYILESLMNYTPQNPGDAELIAERIAPRLQHANSSVVLTTVKVILYLTNYMGKEDEISALCRKLSPPLG
jgi:AP-2 complex subunit beta-1